MKRLFIAAFFLAVCCSFGEDTWLIYHAPGADIKAIQEAANKVVPADISVALRALPTTCETAQDLEICRAAISAGVHVLPSLVLQDAGGTYAALPLRGLSSKGVQAARTLSSNPQRGEHAKQRQLAGDLYYDTSCIKLPGIPLHEKLAAVNRLRILSQSEHLPTETRQLIALRCVYSSLLRLCAKVYDRAHTPVSEQLFLQAVAALELARDLDPLSKLGRLAHDEREKLRAERLRFKKLD